VIPEGLRGTFFRNGPGNNEVFEHQLKHPIDGDGYVCALTIANGQAYFRSKYVRTTAYIEDQKNKKLSFMGQMGTRPPGERPEVLKVATELIQGRLYRPRYRKPANTSVILWGGKLLATWETNLPYTLNPSTLETIGTDDLGGALKLGMMAAHSRVDVEQNRLVTISLRPNMPTSALGICEFDDKWKLLQQQIHEIPGLNYAHDFVLTKNWYIFHMTPMVQVSTSVAYKIMLGISYPGNEMHLHPELPSRIVLIPRHGNGKVRQFDIDPVMIFHYGYAYEEANGNIIFNAACIDKNFTMEFDHGVWLSNFSKAPGRLTTFKINLTEDTIKWEETDRCACEFPHIHPYRDGVPGTRYTYVMACDDPPHNIPFVDIVKHDRLGENRQVWNSGACINEPVFAPRYPDPAKALQADEDDGWVLTQVYHPDTHTTEFVVLDAKNIGAGPVARIKIPHHIPYAFHGSWVPETFIDVSGTPFQHSKL